MTAHPGRAQAGDLLLSVPTMHDPNFEESVVLICQTDREGCHGLILNRPIDLELANIGSLPSSWPSTELPLCWGGPVAPEQLQALQTGSSTPENCFQVMAGLQFGGILEDLESIAAKGEQLRFFLGYSGWGKHQLEQELAEGSWIVVPSEVGDVFDSNLPGIWKRLVAKHDISVDWIDSDPGLN